MRREVTLDPAHAAGLQATLTARDAAEARLKAVLTAILAAHLIPSDAQITVQDLAAGRISASWEDPAPRLVPPPNDGQDGAP